MNIRNNKKYSKIFIKLIIFCLNFFIIIKKNVFAVGLKNLGDIKNQGNAFTKKTGFDVNTSVGGTMAVVIQAFLSLLGIIFVVLMLVAGYNWMTAGGEEEKIRKAKDTIKRAIIGLAIIILSYAITYFVFKYLGEV